MQHDVTPRAYLKNGAEQRGLQGRAGDAAKSRASHPISVEPDWEILERDTRDALLGLAFILLITILMAIAVNMSDSWRY